MENKSVKVGPKKDMRLQNIKKNVIGWILFLPFAILLYFFVLRPQAIGIIYSFFNLVGFTPTGFAGFDNYINVLTNSDFLMVLTNTLKYVFWSLIIGYPLPVIMAIMLNEIVRGQSFFRVSVYIPTIVPTIAASLIWFFVYYPDPAGLLNGFLSLFGVEPFTWLQNADYTILLIVISCTWKGAGATAIFFLASLTSINQELYEAAIVDGAGFMGRVKNITLPQIAPMLVLGFVQQIISVFQIMEQPMTMTGGGPDGASMSMSYWAYKEGFEGFRIGNSLAISTITFCILLILSVFYFKLNKKLEDNV